MQQSDRAHMERALAARAAAQNLSDDAFALWSNPGHTQVINARSNSILVVWRWFMGEPHIITSLNVQRPLLDTRYGIAVLLKDADGAQIVVNHNPIELYPERIFAHVPRQSSISFWPNDKGENIMRFPIVVKSEGNPDTPEDPKVCLTQMGEFRSKFPQYRDIRL